MEIIDATDSFIPLIAQSAAIAVIAGTSILVPTVATRNAEPGRQYVVERNIGYSTVEALGRTPSILGGVLTDNAVAATPRWMRYVSRRLSDIGVGAYDFSGLQIPSVAVLERAWAVAQSYLEADTLPPSVVPSEDGTILFVWHKSEWDLEIETGSRGSVAWAYHRASGEEWSGSLGDRHAELINLLRVMSQT